MKSKKKILTNRTAILTNRMLNEVGGAVQYKPLDKSWRVRAKQRCKTPYGRQGYFCGAHDFRERILTTLEIFSALSNREVFLHKKELYVSLPDVIKIIEGLYAKTKYTKVK